VSTHADCPTLVQTLNVHHIDQHTRPLPPTVLVQQNDSIKAGSNLSGGGYSVHAGFAKNAEKRNTCTDRIDSVLACVAFFGIFHRVYIAYDRLETSLKIGISIGIG